MAAKIHRDIQKSAYPANKAVRIAGHIRIAYPISKKAALCKRCKVNYTESKYRYCGNCKYVMMGRYRCKECKKVIGRTAFKGSGLCKEHELLKRFGK